MAGRLFLAHGGRPLKAVVLALVAVAAIAGGPKEITNTVYRAPATVAAPPAVEAL